METRPASVQPRIREKAAGERTRRIRRAVYEFLALRDQGRDVSVETFQAARADLMPELAEALAAGLRASRHVSDGLRAWNSATDASGLASRPALDDSTPGVVIRGYRLRREIGTGGQGTVYEAVQESTGRRVAIKVVRDTSRDSFARFAREADTLARLDHPGLVAILDRGVTAQGSHYFAVDFADGVDLHEWIATRRALGTSRRDVITLFVRIAEAVGAAHARGIVHRDLKPSNVRVDASGRPRVLDFGMAHLTDAAQASAADRRLTVTGNIVGSVRWASPEQATGDVQGTTPASDVYALGFLLYEALVGRPPYPVDGPLHETTRHICDTRPLDPSRAADGPHAKIDRPLARIIMRCLAKRPTERYGTGAELAESLDAYLSGKSPAGEAPSLMRLVGRPAGAAAAMMAIAMAVAWGVQRGETAVPGLSEVVTLPSMVHPTGIEFVRLPPGRFAMGSPQDEPGRHSNEQPHPVRLTNGVWIGRTEVTRAQYLRVIGSLPPGVDGGHADLPVDRVTWGEAAAFCQMLGEMDGREYRLPSEAEWEYACRSGTAGASTGAVRLSDIAWTSENSAGRPHAVTTKAANRWGLFDTLGNVAEWTSDRYVPYLGTAERTDPATPIGGPSFVIRGGSFLDSAADCRPAARSALPSLTRRTGVGFRVVIVPPRYAGQAASSAPPFSGGISTGANP
jgi:formylglycine-generating enzyme required for sulfatase activity